MSKILTVFCCVVMVFSVLATTASARELSKVGLTVPVPAFYSWSPLGEVVKTQQEGDYFIIDTVTEANGKKHTEQLYISLPKEEGGFRLQSLHELQKEQYAAKNNGAELKKPEVSNVGVFEPASATIAYKKDSTTDAVIMTGSDGTVVRFTKVKGGFNLEVCAANGKQIVAISNEQISFAYNLDGEVCRTMVELPLTDQEAIYNGGSGRYNEANCVGSSFSLANADGYSDDDHSYTNVPFFHSNRGYSIWYNMTYPAKADVGETNANKYTVLFEGDKLDFFMWAGTPLENIKKYTSITGTSGMTEEWTFGFWYGATSHSWEGGIENNIMDNYETIFNSFKTKYGFYPDANYGEGTLAYNTNALQMAKGYNSKMLGWYGPYREMTTLQSFLPGVRPLPTADKNGVITTNGLPYSYNKLFFEIFGTYQFQNTSQIDMSNPNAKLSIIGEYEKLIQNGLAGLMVDFGDGYPYNSLSVNGLSGMEMHNFNSYLYAKVMSEAWDEMAKAAGRNNDYVLFQRAGAAGTQYYMGKFLGDQQSNYEGMLDQVSSMISLAAGGHNLMGGDLSGLKGLYHGGDAENELWARWTVLSVFSPYMRLHSAVLQQPWARMNYNAAYFGNWYYFRKNIVPSVMSAAMDGNLNANPIVKGMMVAYPYQLKLADYNNQYLFCDDFLVSVVEDSFEHTLKVALPSGSNWYSLFTYDAYKGGQTILAEAPTLFMPVFVRDGAVKALNLPESMKLGDMMLEDDMEQYLPHEALLITPPSEKRTSKIYNKEGTSESYRKYDYTVETYVSSPKEGNTFTVTNEEGSNRQIVLALGVSAADITYDGKKLTRLDHMPDYFQEEYGYYVELSGLTTIYLPANWKELSITKGDADYESYEMTVVNGKGAEALVDGKNDTTYAVSSSRVNLTTLALGEEPKPLGRVVLRWTAGFCDSYDVEYTDDGENWSLLLSDEKDKHTVEDGHGSIDVIDFEAVEATQIRMTFYDAGEMKIDPALYAVEAYAPDAFVQIEEGEDWEEDDEWEDLEEDEEEEDEKTGSKKKKKKKIITYGLPVWAIILIVGGGILVLTGAVLLILLLAKKKKKAAAEELAAAEEPPVDTPETPTEE